MMISIIKNRRLSKIIPKALAVVFWLLVWQMLYFAIKQEILIVSPVCVFQRLAQLARQAEFWLTALYSMKRILEGFLLGVLFGTALAVLTSRFTVFYNIFHPVISIIRATPVASFIILALVWMKSGSVPVFTAALIVLPIVWENVSSGIAKTDENLLQMAQVFDFGTAKTVLRIYIPCTAPYFTAACATGLGLAWKAGVAAEVLSNIPLSIGGRIYDAKIYLDTADLFAWTVVVVLMSVLLEHAMAAGMKRIGRKYGGGEL